MATKTLETIIAEIKTAESDRARTRALGAAERFVTRNSTPLVDQFRIAEAAIESHRRLREAAAAAFVASIQFAPTFAPKVRDVARLSAAHAVPVG